jgi:nitrogen fixation/metabolism regulation signal transduction histidine kinase
MKRYLLSVAAALACISLFILASATGNTGLFAERYAAILAVNGGVSVLLAGLLIIQARSLWREYRAGEFGSRLKTRLIAFFALMALVPGLVMYAVSLQFVVRSIESWFDVRVDRALEGGVALGQNALDYFIAQLTENARDIAVELADEENLMGVRLNRLREAAGIQDAVILLHNGHILATASSRVDALVPMLPSLSEIRLSDQNRRHVSIEAPAEEGRLMIRVLVPIPIHALDTPSRFLQVSQWLPESFSYHALAVQEAYQDYQQLSLGREGLQRIYSITLSLALLLALLAALALAVLLARRMAAPLIILAEGTKAVAQGDYRPRQALPSHDELGVLTQSFNEMVRQLNETRALAERNRAAVESARAYLESVLANLSTGVLAFDAQDRLKAVNRGAIHILGDHLEGFENLNLVDWPRFQPLRDAILEGFEDGHNGWEKQIELPCQRESGPHKSLLVRGSRLPEEAPGKVVVFDDISELIAAQRTAAWGEVARRLAHEIKNPLTPIQLSAERLAFKLSDKLEEKDRSILERSTQTIVNQVQAMKNLVNAFRNYARLPAPELVPTALEALIGEILTLYEASDIRIETVFAANAPLVLADASQLRQVVHNLLKNAQDALSETSDPLISIQTVLQKGQIELILRDNGPGFSTSLLSRAFEPYITTKPGGTGLGLAIVQKIILEHGGEIRLQNREQGGAEVRIRLRTTEEHA